ncbi:hypothetical protein [Bradyrhizobium algeriense]|uniref:hypothetical protein n=1 Tax=Bradyrhizobium algeriense TaxID=634784 RepID=UPI0011AE7F82|nr:hypothetical protein [Bradyrhizobium algeriense]
MKTLNKAVVLARPMIGKRERTEAWQDFKKVNRRKAAVLRIIRCRSFSSVFSVACRRLHSGCVPSHPNQLILLVYSLFLVASF